MSDDRLFPDRAAPGADGSTRKAHYGEGEQPWDTMVRLGWGHHFAAGCVIRYLRRTKDRQHSLESARWYYDRLSESHDGHWKVALRDLWEELSEAEKSLLLMGV